MRDTNILTSNGVNLEKSLEILGDMETYDEILGEFLEEMQNKLVKSKAFMDNHDLANYAILVHALKSASRYLGLEALGELFYKHELEAKANNFAFIENHFAELVGEADKAKSLINSYLNPKALEEVIPSNITTKGEKVLIVADDSELIRSIIKRIFEQNYDFKIMFASDGKEVIAILENEVNLNVVGLLLDLNMPNIDGFGVLEYFREKNLFGVVPVSIISGNDEKENIDKAFKYPIVDMLRKPFNEVEIRSIIIKTIK